MQHDLFVHPNGRMRASYPLVVVLQADVAEGDGRVVAPLSRAIVEPPSRIRPLIQHDGDRFIVIMRLLGLLPVRLLRHPVGSIAQYRDDLARALDWLFFGIGPE
jgi:toxin CcdB